MVIIYKNHSHKFYISNILYFVAQNNLKLKILAQNLKVGQIKHLSQHFLKTATKLRYAFKFRHFFFVRKTSGICQSFFNFVSLTVLITTNCFKMWPGPNLIKLEGAYLGAQFFQVNGVRRLKVL